MDKKVIIIKLDNWIAVYFKGKLFAEGHRLSNEKWIRLGILMCEAKIDLSEIVEKCIDDNDVSNESLLWDWPEDINELDSEIVNIIKYGEINNNT